MFPRWSPLWAVQLLSIPALTHALPSSAFSIGITIDVSEVSGKSYDYVIVGGGLAGLVVANRLTENPNNKVLVIEWGGIDNSTNATVPHNANNLNFASMWPTTSAPVKNLGNATFPVYIGGVVGGGSVVNGMAYNRAAADDYDAWEQLGNTEWGFSNLLPYLQKSSHLNTPTPAVAQEYGITWNQAAYSANGPIPATLTNFQFPDLKKFWSAFKDLKVPFPKEHGLGNAVGAFWMPSTVDTRTGVRGDARVEYYVPVQSRPNLELITHSTVTEVLFADGLTASGVKFTSRLDNSTTQVNANKEVILAAGAIHTPQILQLSGIGPKAVVEAAGVKSKLDLPGVGANFQDHPVAYMNFNLSNQAFPNANSLLDPAYNTSAWQQYLSNHTGIYATARGNGVAFLSLPQISNNSLSIATEATKQNASAYLPSAYQDKTLLAGYLAQRQILQSRYRGNDAAVAEYPFSGGTGFFGVAFQKPLSRGTITLDPKSPLSQPVIQYNTFQNPIDKEIMLSVVRYARKWFATPSLASLDPVEILPGAKYQTDDDLYNALVAEGILQPSFAHPACSCAMMPKNKGGVVGSDLRVYGTQRLSIVDASIIPLIPAAHLQATMYGVAEKAADIIKARNLI